MGEAKSGGNTAFTEKRSFARGAKDIEKALEPTDAGKNSRGGKENSTEIFMIDFICGLKGKDDIPDREPDEPEETGS